MGYWTQVPMKCFSVISLFDMRINNKKPFKLTELWSNMKSLAIFVTCPHNPLASVVEIAPLVNKKMPYFCDCFHTEIIFFKLFIWTTLNNHWGLGSHKLLDKLIPRKYIQNCPFLLSPIGLNYYSSKCESLCGLVNTAFLCTQSCARLCKAALPDASSTSYFST